MKPTSSSHDMALLVMDVQNGIVARLDDDDPMLDNLAPTIETARQHDIPTLYVRVAFREGYPEISSNNKSFGQIKKSDAGFDDEHATTIHDSIAPTEDDIIITKKRISAFTGSDLEVVLRSLGINHLIIGGISTSGVVLSTVRQAADKDYKLTVLSDCCADHDAEVHRVLLNKVFPRQAEVITSTEWSESL